MKKLGSVKILAIASVLLILLVAVPVAYGGLRWSGLDPQVVIDGREYSVTVAVPPNQWCKVGSPYQVTFHVPEGAEYELLSETVAGPDDCSITSATSFREHEDLDEPYVTILVSSRGKFRVVATVYSEDSLETCKGHANKKLRCDLPDDDDEGSDE
jgi:hypothetical protein